ncbi:MAG: hypothetical protein C4532_06560 [Candidatus Abyssobacteria bacterium SURF_17]|uniref:Uncharacterized protein n=1 Tax=Candidatus Abyssobacteria bacterium SURF_17 TaxID=2093361 RepID=A0A419F1P5_9BACT|nr:MAG: hypothetical protein C4532_06560 [Candidatus Abyssubacteria bacterium SURF_17]
MSRRERNRYFTTAAVFFLAVGILVLLLARSVRVMAQDYTFRPVGSTSQIYSGGDATDCTTLVNNLRGTVRPERAADENLTSFATTYTDAPFGTGFNLSGQWPFNPQTLPRFIRNVGLFVLRDGANNQILDNVAQWKIEYSDSGASFFVDEGWNEMVRFTLTRDAGFANIGVNDTAIFNVDKSPSPFFTSGTEEAGFIVSLSGDRKTLTLERYAFGEFVPWATTDDLRTFRDEVVCTEFDIFFINEDPAQETLGPAALADDINVETQVKVRTRTRKDGCLTGCPLCGGTEADLAKLRIFDIRVEADWNPFSGGDEPLRILTTSLPDANKYGTYTQYVQATGGRKHIDGYEWEIISGDHPPNYLPLYFEQSNTGASDYDFKIYYPAPPPYTVPGTYNFTVRVTDDSSPAQTAEQALSIYVAGLAIDPPGPELTAAEKWQAYSQTFTAQGGTGAKYWCISAGTIPEGLSLAPYCPTTTTGASITLDGGSPEDAGSFGFTLRLDDEGDEDPVEHFYRLDVSTQGALILPRPLPPMVRGVEYRNDMSVPATYQRMVAPSLTAVKMTYSSSASEVAWTATPVLSGIGLSLANKTLDDVANISRIYIEGTIPIGTTPGNYPYTVKVTDKNPPPPTGDSDSQSIVLTVLDRETKIVKSPPSAATLNSGVAITYSSASNEDALKIGDVLTSATNNVSGTVVIYKPDLDTVVVSHNDASKWVNNIQGPGGTPFGATVSTARSTAYLSFTVFGSGGAPSTQTGDEPDGSQIPYYNYDWKVVPVTGSPALKASEASGTEPADSAPVSAPYTKTIQFVDTNNQPVTGEYDVIFWARDVLKRENDTDPYAFTPATVRIKVVAPGGSLEKDIGRPTKLRQEQFR